MFVPIKHKHKLLILSHLIDFMTCSACFNIESEGVHISALEDCRMIKFSICSSDIHMHKL